MELRTLRYYLAVVREQSISRAAESLNITQPTLSRQMMELEKELGTSLLIRGGKNHGVTLTEDGLLLRRRAEEIVELADKTKGEFSWQDRELHGDISIGAGETDAMRLFAAAARIIQERYPQIHYHLFSGNAEEVSERLDKGLLDFGVMIGEADLSRYDFLPLPTGHKWGVLLRKDSPLAEKAVIRPEELANQRLILSQQSVRSNELSGWFGRSQESLDIVATYNLVFNASFLVEEGFGCAVTIDKLIRTGKDSPLCFRPLEPTLESRLNLVWKKYQVFSRAAELFLHQLRSIGGAMPETNGKA